ncbi:unnamed protein product [Caenorhabditis angaria]|uniref:Uncharacterized protein n=1 Tax=Caenorhabditis angaria TaxID=860376 RepID=A0A9P1J1L8_9PELO|nr:unnamed protein product [Caenorhabditis angaria]
MDLNLEKSGNFMGNHINFLLIFVIILAIAVALMMILLMVFCCISFFRNRQDFKFSRFFTDDELDDQMENGGDIELQEQPSQMDLTLR